MWKKFLNSIAAVELSTTETRKRVYILVSFSVVATLACSFWIVFFADTTPFEHPEHKIKDAFFSFSKAHGPHPILIRMLTDWIFFGLGLCIFVGGFYNFILGKPLSYLIFSAAFLTLVTASVLQSLAMSRLIYSGDSPKTYLVFAWFFLRYMTLTCLSIGAVFSLRPHKISCIGAFFFLLLTLSVFIFYSLFSNQGFHLLFSENFLTVNMFYLPLFFWVSVILPLFLLYFRKSPSYFSLALVLSIIPQIALEASLNMNKRVIFSSGFSGIHLLEILSVLIPFVGLSYDHFGFYRALEKEKLNTLRATESKLFFLSTITDDARAFLSSLHTHAATLAKEEDPQKQLAIHGMTTSAQQVEALLENLLTLSSLEKNQIVIKKKVVSIKSILLDCLLCANIKQEIQDFEDQKIETDPKLLKQVLINTIILFKKTPLNMTFESPYLTFEGKKTPWTKETIKEIKTPFQEKQTASPHLLKDQLAVHFSANIMSALGGTYTIDGDTNVLKIKVVLPIKQESKE